jgi:hypothetical protein
MPSQPFEPGFSPAAPLRLFPNLFQLPDLGILATKVSATVDSS